MIATRPQPDTFAPTAFTHHKLAVNGTRLHYAEIGSGDPVLLLPGWPQHWYAWRKVAPLLAAQGRRAIMLDLRGLGDSDKPSEGYDLDTAAADVHGFIETAGLLERAGGIDVVSHDLGAIVAYALAAGYPGDVARLVMSEVTVPRPGQARPVPDDATNVKTWHFGFNRLPDLPELLITGRERVYLDWLFDNKSDRPWTIEPDARESYARAFAAGGTRAGFDYYRALFRPDGLKRMEERLSRPLPMPVLAIGATGGVGELLFNSLQGAATNVRGAVMEDCGHYVLEECPGEFTELVTNFWRDAPAAQS